MASRGDRKTDVGGLTHEYSKRFRREPMLCVQAPGRVNLIGEHTDYNDGFVFPAAIDRHITLLASPRSDSQVRAYSADFSQESSFEQGPGIERSRRAPWSNYLRGVFVQYFKRGDSLQGIDLMVQGDVPIGAGLSSSAALEVACAETCRVLNQIEISPAEMALLSQAAEREFVGVQCGIMDQFVCTLARENTGLLLDCRDLSYSLVPMEFDARIVVCDSRVKRSLDNSEYNQRRTQCEEAVRLLQEQRGPIRALRDVSLDDLVSPDCVLTGVLLKRSRHVVSENARVQEAVEALKKSELEHLGRLLYASHSSLRDDYEVSCRELDLLVELAASQEGTLGARMTGAGFGGCTVNLVRTWAVDSFCAKMREEYLEKAGIEPFVYVCRPSGGVSSKPL